MVMVGARQALDERQPMIACMTPPNRQEALRIFHEALAFVEASGQQDEVEWHSQLSPAAFTETDLLRETAWVILCSGFRESVVQKIFDYISLCFCDWSSATDIVEAFPGCKLAALRGFANEDKIDAICRVAAMIH